MYGKLHISCSIGGSYFKRVHPIFHDSLFKKKIALFPWTSHMVLRGLLFGLSFAAWKGGLCCTKTTIIRKNFGLAAFHVQCFSTRRSRSSKSLKVNPKPRMAEESDAFYVVRKGDIIGVYKSFSDCQAQVSSSVVDPSVSVYKGYSLCKEAEDYLCSHGLKGALYSMHATHLKDDMFGVLVPCPFQQPDGLAFLVEKEEKKTSLRKRTRDVEPTVYGDEPNLPPTNFRKMSSSVEVQPISHKSVTCILEFDGASKGNPGKAGAGAVLRTEDGTVISHVREGLGIATNNAAEYRALILGLKNALMRGFKHIRVQGDSQLVCMQVQDLWQTKNQNMADLCKEVKKLKEKFLSFNIMHVKREFNAVADNLANMAITLPVGEVFEDFSPLG
ncbi:hypothetical protein HPP92_022090 [Vanilla planifolia]|uniref:RNase H type-1 domain-containing protein n=1 Tax=Vanilla planifolia TaxID=51239 RepID=A0A835UES9_VANPL|nr:hypothetical protein HPP92_022398 [Vanilla planifolia]KAG0458962.1 hypothetical protein HPP92_022090 [Vanilla planifolia]